MLFFKSIIFSGLNCPPFTVLSDVREGVQENLRAGGEVNTLPSIHVLFPSLTDSHRKHLSMGPVLGKKEMCRYRSRPQLSGGGIIQATDTHPRVTKPTTGHYG